MFYALAHNQAKLLEKINLFAALAPVTVITEKAGITHFPGGTFAECEIRKQLGNLAGIWDVFPTNKMHQAMRIVDNLATQFNWFKDWFIHQVETHEKWDDLKATQVAMRNFPDHISTKEMMHYGHIMQ